MCQKSFFSRANRRRHGRNCKKRQMPSGISARFSHKNLRTCAQRRANRQSPFCPRAFRRSLGHFCKHHGKKGIFSPNPRNSQLISTGSVQKHRQSTCLVEPTVSMCRCPWVVLTDRSFLFATGVLRTDDVVTDPLGGDELMLTLCLVVRGSATQFCLNEAPRKTLLPNSPVAELSCRTADEAKMYFLNDVVRKLMTSKGKYSMPDLNERPSPGSFSEL